MGVFVQGQNAETAQKLLDAAEQVGAGEDAVRTVEDGFLVPEDVADAAYPEGQAVPEPEPPAEPTE